MKNNPVDNVINGDFTDWHVNINGEETPKANEITKEEMLKLKEHFGNNMIIIEGFSVN